jgi:phage-related protein
LPSSSGKACPQGRSRTASASELRFGLFPGSFARIYLLIYSSTADTPIARVGSSLEDFIASPDDARREAGYQLRRVQQGPTPGDGNPTATVGIGVYEIRIPTAVEHRIFYVAKFAEAIYVLHAFEKRTRQTRQADIDLARKRLADIIQARRR